MKILDALAANKTYHLAFLLILISPLACINRQANQEDNNPSINSSPEFKYNPNATKLGIIKKEQTTCPVCNTKRDYVYEGPFYSEDEVEGICPWCIKDGSAAKKFNAEFQDPAACDSVEKKEYLEELVTRTPGYTAWQEPRWLSHCGDFCALKDYVGWKEIAHIKEELIDDFTKINEEYGLTQQELEKYLVSNGSLQGYLFQCLHCGKHRLIIDVD